MTNPERASSSPDLKSGETPADRGTEPSGEKLKGNAELYDFFLRAAELMQLAPKRPASARVTTKGARATLGWTIRLLRTPRARKALLVTVAVASVAVALSSATRSVPLPDAARGTWRTESGAYANRRFELGETTLAFQTDDRAQAVARHVITHVRKSTVPDGTLYRVDYLDQPDDKSPLTFEFILVAGDDPTIIFANQKKVVWKRVSSTAPDTH